MWDGWSYYYEMADMTQWSPMAPNTERKFKRVPREVVDEETVAV